MKQKVRRDRMRQKYMREDERIHKSEETGADEKSNQKNKYKK